MDLKQKFESRGLGAKYDEIVQQYGEQIAAVIARYERRKSEHADNWLYEQLDVSDYLCGMGNAEQEKWSSLETLFILGDDV